MKFLASLDTDIGITKETNQDSLLLKQAVVNGKEVLMAVVCDGMGGLEKGELASATVIKAFDEWFETSIIIETKNPNMEIIGNRWELLLKQLNMDILEYASRNSIKAIGTTFSGILFIEDDYIICHVGDSRVYEITNNLKQLTQDHTFIAREIKKGTMTAEMAKNDKRRNLLLQCIGASQRIEPQIVIGKRKIGNYLLCSDGFRHEISDNEVYEKLNFNSNKNETEINNNIRTVIELLKHRNERDNISAILIKSM